jgi:hypothetical protein
MGKEITITLDQLKRFLDQPYHNRFVMLESAEQPLRDSFNNNVFTNHNDTKQIVSQKELETLIAKGGRSHVPATPRRGKKYNSEYLVRKIRGMGETRPHVYENYGFLHGTDIYLTGKRLVMRTKSIIQRGFDYLAHHETQRSVLKLTILRAWQTIMDNMVEALIKEARKP